MSTAASIKEQFISLQYDLEDKEKIATLLQKRIDQHRDELNQIDHTIRDRYKQILQEETAKHQHVANEWTQKSQDLMVQKAEMLKQCKDLMAELQSKDQDLQAEIRSLYREAERDLESERKQFKFGYDDRLQKFLSQKAHEYKESTNRAMEPEFLRLQQMHERELEEVKMHYAAEERKLRESMKIQYQSNLDDEKSMTKDEFKAVLQTIQDKYSRELEHLIRDHKNKIRILQEDSDRELEKCQKQCQDKNAKTRKTWYDEITSIQDLSHQRLLELQRKHRQQIEQITTDHETQLQQLHTNHQLEKRRLAKALQQRAAAFSDSDGEADDVDDEDFKAGEKLRRSSKKSPKAANTEAKLRSSVEDNDEDDEVRIRDPLSPSKFVSQGLLPDSKPIANKAKKPSSKQNTPTNRKSPSSLDIKQLSLELQQKYEVARREAEQQRNKQIQSEIRLLESETMQLERELQVRFQQEKQRIEQFESKEEEALQKRCQQLQDEVTDLITQREVTYQQLQEETQREAHYQQEMEKLKHEIHVYKEGIKAHRNRMSEKEEQERLALKTLELEHAPKTKELRVKCEQCQQRMKTVQDDWDREMEVLKEQHGQELTKLDREVKTEVAKREEDIIQLREVLADGRAKLSKIRMLIEKYDKQLSAAEENQNKDTETVASRATSVSSRAAAARTTSSNLNMDDGEDRNADNRSYRSVRTTASIATASTRSTIRPTHLQNLGGGVRRQGLASTTHK